MSQKVAASCGELPPSKDTNNADTHSSITPVNFAQSSAESGIFSVDVQYSNIVKITITIRGSMSPDEILSPENFSILYRVWIPIIAISIKHINLSILTPFTVTVKMAFLGVWLRRY